MGKDHLIKEAYLSDLNHSDWFSFNVCLVLLALLEKINFSVTQQESSSMYLYIFNDRDTLVPIYEQLLNKGKACGFFFNT